VKSIKAWRAWTETTTRLETDPIARSKYDATADADRAIVDRVALLAEKRGVPMAHVSLAWLLQKESVVAPVIGATKLSHLESAVNALSLRLTPEEMTFLEELYIPHPIVGLIPYSG